MDETTHAATHPPQLWLCINPEEHHHKFYRLSLLPGAEVLAEWGQIGGNTQRQVKPYTDANGQPDQAAAEKALAARVRQLERDEYQLQTGTEIPTGRDDACPWCHLQGAQAGEGWVALPYPSHIPRDALSGAGRSKWIAATEALAARMGGPALYYPPGPHALVLLLGVAPDNLNPAPAAVSSPRAATLFDGLE